jgi:hypothetical protein
LKIANWKGLLASSGWVVWIHEKLQLARLICIRPINHVHLLHLGNEKYVGEENYPTQKEAKQRRIWKTYSWPLSGLKFFNRSVITVLYVERTIAIYDLF